MGRPVPHDNQTCRGDSLDAHGLTTRKEILLTRCMQGSYIVVKTAKMA